MRNLMIAILVFAGFAPAQDPDRDGLPTPVELALGTDPQVADTDADGVPDGTEAVAPNGDPLDPAVCLRGEGVRGFVWRDGETATFYVVVRATSWGAPTVSVLARGYGSFSLVPMLRLAAAGSDGTVTLAVSWPASLLQAVGGQMPFRIALGDLRWSGTLLSHGGLWFMLEAVPGGTRRVPAEIASVAPFPSVGHLGLRTCAQELKRLHGSPDYGYGVYIVSDEGCLRSGPFCVLDCGEMIGVVVILLDPVSR